MDQVYVIRHKVLVERQSARRVAREMGVSRVTVKRYLDGAPPGVRTAVERARPVSDAVRGRLEQSRPEHGLVRCRARGSAGGTDARIP